MLTVEDLHVSYGLLEVVKGISFTVGEAEIVTILGSNGAGKSTTLRALSGLPSQKRGRIEFAGADISGLPAHQVMARGLCLVPEGRQLFPDHTVMENLQLGAFRRLRTEPASALKADFEEIFALFPRIKDRLWQKAGLLSGGEQQMVAIARALLGRPRLIMLDEPSLGLAPKLVRSIFQSFARLRERGVTLLLVERLAWVALEICDRAYVLEAGHLTLSGSRDQMMRHPRVVEAYLGRSSPRANPPPTSP
jgi:branched-chain amino acid transport system ATP-binding protein